MFQPTHRHSDGGFYRYVNACPGKSVHTDDPDWEDGVIYQSDDETYRWTSIKRWNDRFTPLEKTPDRQVKVMEIQSDEGELICSFQFNYLDAGDVRTMFVTAGPGANSVTRKDEMDHMKRVLFAQAEMVSQGLHLRAHDFPDLIGDVAAFHAKFGQEYTGKPRQLPQDLHDFRVKFHDEETDEYRDEYAKLCDAIVRQDRRDIIFSLEQQLDALVDAAWVLLGTADLQFGRDKFHEAWRRVVKANMAKVLATDDPNAKDSGREVKYDIRKPSGWLPPDHRDLVEDNAVFDEIFALPAPDVETNTYNQDAGSYSDTRPV